MLLQHHVASLSAGCSVAQKNDLLNQWQKLEARISAYEHWISDIMKLNDETLWSTEVGKTSGDRFQTGRRIRQHPGVVSWGLVCTGKREHHFTLCIGTQGNWVSIPTINYLDWSWVVEGPSIRCIRGATSGSWGKVPVLLGGSAECQQPVDNKLCMGLSAWCQCLTILFSISICMKCLTAVTNWPRIYGHASWYYWWWHESRRGSYWWETIWSMIQYSAMVLVDWKCRLFWWVEQSTDAGMYIGLHSAIMPPD